MTDLIEIVTDIIADEVIAELETPETAPEATEQPADEPGDATPDEATEPEAPAAAHALAYPAGSASQQILDCFLDGESDQLSMTELKGLLAHVAGNTVEQGVRRLFKAGRLQKTAPGVYRLGDVPSAAAKSAEPAPEPAPVPEPSVPDPEAARLEADRERKRLARERDRDVAMERARAADAELRDKLTQAAGHNVQVGAAGLSDLSVPRCALRLGIPLPTILSAVSAAHGLQACPQNPRAETWRSPDLLRRIARYHARALERQILAHLEAARAPQPPPVEPEAAAAGQVPLDAQNAPATPPQQPEAIPGEELDPSAGGAVQAGNMGQDHIEGGPPSNHAQDAVDIADAMGRLPGRDEIVARFRRAEASPQRQAAPEPADRPWFAGSREPAREDDGLSDDGLRFLLEGWRAGNVAWNARRHGPPPGSKGCRVPPKILREFGYD
jgi:hypothetical protein